MCNTLCCAPDGATYLRIQLQQVFVQLIINCVMYRNEEASDPLINKLERQSLPSFSTIVGTGGRVLVFSISSCVTEVHHLRCRGVR